MNKFLRLFNPAVCPVGSSLLSSLVGLVLIVACNSMPWAGLVRGGTPTLAATRPSSFTSTPTAMRAAGLATPVVTHAVWSSLGKVTQVQALSGDQVRVKLTPEDQTNRVEFVIGDWKNVTVWFFWPGLETPTPVADARKLDIVKGSVGRTVTIGYKAASPLPQDPATVVFFGSRKKTGDPQK